ncbi:unnamed protein product [Ambrosiozyma monospora]|uniref:Unnamed protein product n=1 Tax=Ambrosiozyma monospora TaxID=43982 RepID=A0ACB5SRE7_AMBMO|nr:unnamed protein product [Ambrosiozyma monospora]
MLLSFSHLPAWLLLVDYPRPITATLITGNPQEIDDILHPPTTPPCLTGITERKSYVGTSEIITHESLKHISKKFHLNQTHLELSTSYWGRHFSFPSSRWSSFFKWFAKKRRIYPFNTEWLFLFQVGHINNGFSDYCPLCDPHKEDPLFKGVKHPIFNCRITERLWSLTTNLPPIFRIPTNVLANTNLENSEIFQLNLYVGMVHQMYKRAFTHNDYGRNADIQPIEWHEHNIRPTRINMVTGTIAPSSTDPFELESYLSVIPSTSFSHTS